MASDPRPQAPTLHALTRSALVMVGLLLLGVGVGNTLAGRSKIVEYEGVLRGTPAPPPADPAALFPRPTELEERRELALAKVAFYQLLLTFGQVLSAAGFALVAAGVLRILSPFRSSRIDFPTPGV